MEKFDKPRCVRIISDVIEALDESMREHTEVVDYVSPEEMLVSHAELAEDKRAMQSLREHLESDCE